MVHLLNVCLHCIVPSFTCHFVWKSCLIIPIRPRWIWILPHFQNLLCLTLNVSLSKSFLKEIEDSRFIGEFLSGCQTCLPSASVKKIKYKINPELPIKNWICWYKKKILMKNRWEKTSGISSSSWYLHIWQSF